MGSLDRLEFPPFFKLNWLNGQPHCTALTAAKLLLLGMWEGAVKWSLGLQIITNTTGCYDSSMLTSMVA